MTESINIYLEGRIVENDVEFTLVELCRASGASEEEVVLWVSEGAFEPHGDGPQEWRFSGAVLSRVLTAKRLARDFEINAPGIALALDLLDQIDALRASPKHSIRQ